MTNRGRPLDGFISRSVASYDGLGVRFRLPRWLAPKRIPPTSHTITPQAVEPDAPLWRLADATVPQRNRIADTVEKR
jgi:hypothetical protein